MSTAPNSVTSQSPSSNFIVNSAPVQPSAPPWYVQFAINSGIVALHQALHNPSQAAYLKTVLLELRDAISATYPGE